MAVATLLTIPRSHGLALDLDVEQDPTLDFVEYLVESGIGSPANPARTSHRRRVLELGEGEIGNPAAAVGRPIESFVVDNDNVTVGSQCHIDLHHVGPDLIAARRRR